VAGEGPAPPAPPPVACGVAQENEVLALACPGGGAIGGIAFASFGLPTGSCAGKLARDTECDANTTMGAVTAACVGKSGCHIRADDDTFGDPCRLTKKQLAVRLQCAHAGDGAALLASSSERLAFAEATSGTARVAVDYTGFVPGVVPGSVQKPGDLSWTAAYPQVARPPPSPPPSTTSTTTISTTSTTCTSQVARYLLRYHGALGAVRDHWASIKLWADGAARVAGPQGLPDFFTWGAPSESRTHNLLTPHAQLADQRLTVRISLQATGAPSRTARRARRGRARRRPRPTTCSR
jgi:hypothetical protein